MKLEIIRHFDKLGRIVIPKDFRRSMGVTTETNILISVSDEGILLRTREDDKNGEPSVQQKLTSHAITQR